MKPSNIVGLGMLAWIGYILWKNHSTDSILKELRKDVSNQMGGLVFIASQCKDFFNKKMEELNQINKALKDELVSLHQSNITLKCENVQLKIKVDAFKDFPEKINNLKNNSMIT